MKIASLKLILTYLVFLAALGAPFELAAHDGPVDEDGCHLDGSGRLHCH